MAKFLTGKKTKKKLIPLCQDMNYTRSLMINGCTQSTGKHRCTAVHPGYQHKKAGGVLSVVCVCRPDTGAFGRQVVRRATEQDLFQLQQCHHKTQNSRRWREEATAKACQIFAGLDVILPADAHANTCRKRIALQFIVYIKDKLWALLNVIFNMFQREHFDQSAAFPKWQCLEPTNMQHQKSCFICCFHDTASDLITISLSL